MKSITIITLALAAISWSHAEEDGKYHPGFYGDVRYRYSKDPYYRRLAERNGKYGSIYKAYQPQYYQAPSREILSPLQVKLGGSVDQSPYPSTLSYRNPAVPIVSTYRPFVYTTPKPFAVTKSHPTTYFKSVVDGAASIVRENRNFDENNYHFSYETDNGIAAEESGVVDSPVNGIGGGTKVRGFYEYIGDDGHKYRVDYIADENGYRASGAHLPQTS
ncbi:unnamed protein product [Arctia plantaginis]|uniref:Uncharacterized protein n=1 Tax=Arctia plantaginis TaxID=874455 RepID=A0A8S0YPJ1_ARCPL|nr:unnamed protein product [Arctia plantaginis]